MTFNRRMWALHWAGLPTEQDWTNLNVSRVRQVMMPLHVAFSQRPVLAHLAALGMGVVIRVEEGTYYDEAGQLDIRLKLDAIRAVCALNAVVIGNEPEGPFDLRWGSPSWGQPRAWEHRNAVYTLAMRLSVFPGVKIISPGWTHRRITPDDPPQPGRTAWREITAPVYSALDGNGAHIYCHQWLGAEDINRFLWALGGEQERCHQPVWLLEVGVNTGTELDRMSRYIGMTRLIEQHLMGGRVEFFCPFISAGDPGDPPAWNRGYLLRDPAAYRALGAFMAERT